MAEVCKIRMLRVSVCVGVAKDARMRYTCVCGRGVGCGRPVGSGAVADGKSAVSDRICVTRRLFIPATCMSVSVCIRVCGHQCMYI